MIKKMPLYLMLLMICLLPAGPVKAQDKSPADPANADVAASEAPPAAPVKETDPAKETAAPVASSKPSTSLSSILSAIAAGLPMTTAPAPQKIGANGKPVYGPVAETPAQRLIALREDEINPSLTPSLLFTYWEYKALVDARRTSGVLRTPTTGELNAALNMPEPGPETHGPPGIRELSLDGITYLNKTDWTIWLNSVKYTPKALPTQAIDLVVHDNYIEVKWFDEYTNQIFPVRLRPHQRFNLDNRVFLPGSR